MMATRLKPVELYTELAADRKKMALKAVQYLHSALQHSDVPWSNIMEVTVNEGKVTKEQIRRALGVSSSTISRWLSGEAEPHHLMKPESIKRLISLIGT